MARLRWRGPDHVHVRPAEITAPPRTHAPPDQTKFRSDHQPTISLSRLSLPLTLDTQPRHRPMRLSQLLPLLTAVLPLALAVPRGQIPLGYLGGVSVSETETNGRAGWGTEWATQGGQDGEVVEHVEASTVGYLSKWSSEVKRDFIQALRENRADEW